MVILLALTGCATIDPPQYIRAEHPYERTYYGEFRGVLDAVRLTLKENGWDAFKEVDANTYERNPLLKPGDEENVLIFTTIRRTQRFVYAKAVHLNVYVSRVDDGVKVDLRYGAVTDLRLWKVRSYHNDRLIKKIQDGIEQKLLSGK